MIGGRLVALACATSAVALAVTAACSKREHHDEPRVPVKHDAGIAPVDWAACDAALAAAPGVAALDRAGAIIAACAVCGDWHPLLDWARPPEDGGPTRAEIESAMTACDAYCGAESKDRFLGTLDGARGGDAVAPWRWLAKTCKDQVSAVPDPRFASPELFALDRIARAAFAHGDGGKLAAIELPLPPVSVTGAGLAVAHAQHLAPALPARHVTVTETEVRTGPLPRGKLGEHGVAVDLGDAPYPGALVTDVAKLPAETYALIAPRAMAAVRVADALEGAAGVARFAALPANAPAHWAVAGVIPVDVTFVRPAAGRGAVMHVGDAAGSASADQVAIVEVRAGDTVEQVVGVIDALAAAGRKSAAVVRAP